MELIFMPESSLLLRSFFEHLGYTQQWREAMSELTDAEREELYTIIFKNDFNHIDDLTENEKFCKILKFYKNYRGDISDHNSELFRYKQEFDQQKNNVLEDQPQAQKVFDSADLGIELYRDDGFIHKE